MILRAFFFRSSGLYYLENLHFLLAIVSSFWFLLARSSSHVNGLIIFCACAVTVDPQNDLYPRFQKCSDQRGSGLTGSGLTRVHCMLIVLSAHCLNCVLVVICNQLQLYLLLSLFKFSLAPSLAKPPPLNCVSVAIIHSMETKHFL